MSCFAVAHITGLTPGPWIRQYLERIEATLEPFGGRYVLHGGAVETLEGQWSGDLVAIEFPDRATARSWYDSNAYRAIRPLRTGNSTGTVILIDRVADNHRATDILPSKDSCGTPSETENI